MAQASALAIGSACALRHESVSVVQTPLRPLYRHCTSNRSGDLADATTSSLFAVLKQRGGGLLHQDTAIALRELVATMKAIADGSADPCFYLSSLDPGVGKTTTLIRFVTELLGSEQHEGVAVLLCFSRLEEIARLVEEMGLDEADYAVLTSDDEANRLSSTLPSEARVLFTTHSMVMSRCRGHRFSDVEVFHYLGEVRAVRIWDEAMLPGEVVSLNTDQLAALREPLRLSHPALAQMVEELELALKASDGSGTYDWPDVEDATGIALRSARQGLEQRQASYLEGLYALSGRCVLLRRPHNATKVITALDSRDAIPDDFAPVVILDASGRVRSTYSQWEKHKGNLVRLPSAVRSYRNLTVHVMDKGSGKTTWTQNGNALAREVAIKIDSKPDEEWLVIYHKGVNGGAIPDQVMGLLSSDPSRVHFLNWGKHQGTNKFRHIQNVILAGMNNHPETDYEMKARHYSGIPNDHDVPKALVDDMQAGEHMHHILQALCRSAVRQGNGSDCSPCNAYIIAPKRSGIRAFLTEVFPGCTVSTWLPTEKKPKGKVQQALLFVEMHFKDCPDEVLLFTKLQSELEITNASNFRNRIRHHEDFKAGLEALGVEEVTVGNRHHRNAFARKPMPFGPVAGAS
ncbi:hypothetical protein ROG8370_01291 [Roseovarius gaetbuli]|uniref:Uncharacterized protein n=1 Tax=Roseovarius gaetbuli TaxID=1356575 RepID=A0A1X6YW14_9RHOB|nr:hypothetical protein [Roseovarius gaetbuli]SLN32579.1 hypothetical protein ROG8370_01291 [Roseovarius gaetbuli]